MRLSEDSRTYIIGNSDEGLEFEVRKMGGGLVLPKENGPFPRPNSDPAGFDSGVALLVEVLRDEAGD